jgi:hypothetical protein
VTTDVIVVDDLLSDREVMPSVKTTPVLTIGPPKAVKHSDSSTEKRAPTAKRAASARPKGAAGKDSSPLPSPRRRPVGDMLGELIEKLAVLAGSFNPPGARALAFASPALGSSLDGIVAGTMIDKRVLQPLTAGTEKWATLASALGLPMMVAAVSMQPELFPVLETQIRAAMVVCLDERVKVLRKRRHKEQDVAKALSALVELDPQFAESQDPIGDLLHGFLEMPAVPEGEPSGAAV